MSRQPPRYIKLQDFPAHNGNVNCIKIGQKSSGVLVTGGDDKKVNLWTIGAQTKALSLQGHQTPVDSVTFDHNEEVVAAGASSGSIKLFDLDQAKVTRAMSGHGSNVLSLELSQYGLISGSMDTKVKVWDLRGRDAICSFKGHKSGVSHVKFSPDGKWVASASEDGQVKIWDLVANKQLAELAGHTHAITGLHFHPVEYLLGTSSADKTVKIWDLEHMTLVESTPPEATGVRAMAFHPDGRHVFSALQDGLRVWSWEPSPCMQHDVVDMPWYKVADMSMLSEKNKVVGCSFNQNFVGLWVVDLKDVRPFGSGGGGRQSVSEFPQGAGGPAIAAVARSEPSLQAAAAPPQGNAVRAGMERESKGNGTGVNASAPMLPSSRPAVVNALSPQRVGGMGEPSEGRHRSMGVAGRGGLSDREAAVGSSGGGNADRSSASADRPLMLAPSGVINRLNSAGGGSASRYAAAAAGDSFDVPPQPRVASGFLSGPQTGGSKDEKSGMVSIGVGVGDSLFRGQVEPGHLYSLAAQEASAVGQRLEPAGGIPRANRPSSRDEGDRQQRQQQQAGRPAAEAAPTRSADTDLLADVASSHGKIKSSLASRLSNLQLSRSFLQRGDVRGALAAARRCGDATVGADVLSGLLLRHDVSQSCTLDLVPEMVPVIEQVLSLVCDHHIQAGLEMASLLYKAFHQVIRDTCSQAARVGVDLSFEQRREKCMTARISLQGLAPKLAHASRQLPDGFSFKAKALAGDLATL